MIKLNKLFITLFLYQSLFAVNLISVESKINNASYFIIENSDIFNCFVSGKKESEYVKFYTFDGKLIKQITHGMLYITNIDNFKKKLDPNAKKPRIVKYKVKYWAGIKILNGYKVLPGDFILFYDCNGNVVYWARYNGSDPENKKYISYCFGKKLDLSIAKYEK